jgi:hypothetical protein
LQDCKDKVHRLFPHFFACLVDKSTRLALLTSVGGRNLC